MANFFSLYEINSVNISVSSNIASKLLADMHDLWNNGNYKGAFEVHLKLINLHDAMFCESSPGPVKFAAEKIGLCKSEARLPIVEISDVSKEKVINAIKLCNIK